MGEIRKTAYLRDLESSKQCELMFALSVKLKNVGLLEEQVKAVRQATDTVESLLQHIVNKIQKSIKTLRENNGDSSGNDVQVNVSLINGWTREPISPKMVLKNLIQIKLNNIEFRIFDQHYVVVINAPLVKDIRLPPVLYANYKVQARKLHCLFTDNTVSQFFWYKSKDKVNWVRVGNSSRYYVKEDDIDHYLKLVFVPCNSILTGPSTEVISENKVELMGDLPECPFEQRHESTTEKLQNNNFRMVSYNILSSRYTDADDAFSYCPPQALAIDYRKQLITLELSGYKADIMCLQEVDSSVYTSYYKDHFKNQGYMSFYHRKGNQIPEGLACFFDTSRFRKEDDRQIIYTNEIKHKLYNHCRNFVEANKEFKELFMKQKTSLHITVLKFKTTDKSHFIIIGNTHLFYRPDAELVRIIQIHMATTYLNFLSKQYSQNRDADRVKVILCGDFNSSPSSAVFDYITRGKLSKSHPIFANSRNSIDLSHSFQFESACGVPKYTNYTSDFKSCLDYIFIEKNKMSVNRIIPLPTEEDLAAYEGLPNEVYPSDHLALVVDLQVK